MSIISDTDKPGNNNNGGTGGSVNGGSPSNEDDNPEPPPMPDDLKDVDKEIEEASTYSSLFHSS